MASFVYNRHVENYLDARYAGVFTITLEDDSCFECVVFEVEGFIEDIHILSEGKVSLWAFLNRKNNYFKYFCYSRKCAMYDAEAALRLFLAKRGILPQDVEVEINTLLTDECDLFCL